MFENMTRNLSNTIESKAELVCHLENHVWQKMMGWCKSATSEVSGMGLCKIEKGVFKVYEVFFPLQYGSSGYTELDDRALAKLQIGLYKKKIPANHFRFWWHTHYNFNVFWSGTDDGNATTLARANGEWELSLVINQAGDFRCRADFFKKVHPLVDEKFHVMVDNMKVFTCPNSKRQRHKPHFKADIRKWVKPMSELPEKQKPKFTQCTPTTWTPPDASDDGFGYQGEFGDYWRDRTKKNYASQAYEPYCMHCDNRFCDDGDICKKNKKGSEDKKTITKKYSELQDGDSYADFIFHKGHLLDPHVYRTMMQNLKNNDNGEAKEESYEQMAERIDREVEEVSTHEFCACGDEQCKDYSMCVHCDLCQGRCQGATGYCPGCFNYYENVDGGINAEPKPEITH